MSEASDVFSACDSFWRYSFANGAFRGDKLRVLALVGRK